MARRIGRGKAMLIYGTAGFIDLAQAVLDLFTGGIAGLFQTVFGIIGYGIIWLMFATSGVSFFPAKKITKAVNGASGAVSTIKNASDKAEGSSLLIFVILIGLELIPEIGSFVPSITINSIMTVKSSWAEDDAKDEEENYSQNTIRAKAGGVQNTSTPKTPGVIREAKNRVS